jgi:hypothetical protein
VALEHELYPRELPVITRPSGVAPGEGDQPVEDAGVRADGDLGSGNWSPRTAARTSPRWAWIPTRYAPPSNRSTSGPPTTRAWPGTSHRAPQRRARQADTAPAAAQPAPAQTGAPSTCGEVTGLVTAQRYAHGMYAALTAQASAIASFVASLRAAAVAASPRREREQGPARRGRGPVSDQTRSVQRRRNPASNLRPGCGAWRLRLAWWRHGADGLPAGDRGPLAGARSDVNAELPTTRHVGSL